MLTVTNLTVDIAGPEGSLRVVNDVSFSLAAGETLALVGESGCGKSMTALALMRLLPQDALVAAGDVTLAGESLIDLTESAMCARRGRRIAMVFQEASGSLNPVLTVGEQIDEVLRLNTVLSREERRSEVIRWLDRVGIPDPENRFGAYPMELSGGQKQRVLIAMALAGHPDVVIADEPTTALDVTLQAQVMTLLKKLQQERGTALLLITHDLAVVKQYADRVALMYAGEIVETAPCRDFFASPRHPYARGLLAAVPTRDKRGAALEGIPGRVPTLSELTQMTGCRFAPRCPAAHAVCRRQVPPWQKENEHAVRCVGRSAVLSPSAASTSAAAVQSSCVLTVERLSVTYERRRGFWRAPEGIPAVKNVSLTLSEGETLALVGESGSGKTTLGRALLGLAGAGARVSGRVTLAGEPVLTGTAFDAAAVRRTVQMIFQDPYASLDPRMTVGETIAEGMWALSVGRDEAQRRKRIEELLDWVELPRDAARKLPHEFSGGQRQRIAIARALAVSPKILICDEPTSALDVSVQAQTVNLLKRLQAVTKTAYLFITHNFAVVEYFADRVAVMKAGSILETGTTETVLSHPKNDYTRTLLNAVPRL